MSIEYLNKKKISKSKIINSKTKKLEQEQKK